MTTPYIELYNFNGEMMAPERIKIVLDCLRELSREHARNWNPLGNDDGLKGIHNLGTRHCLEDAIILIQKWETAELDAQRRENGLRYSYQVVCGYLRHATSIGMATILVRCGAYKSLTPYLKRQYDELTSLRNKAEDAGVEVDALSDTDKAYVAHFDSCRICSYTPINPCPEGLKLSAAVRAQYGAAANGPATD